MGRLAYLFPGQGSQYRGMGRELFDSFASARAVFEEADRALGFSVSELCFNGSDEDVKRAVELASAGGAKRAVMLPVSAPFHSELMRPAQDRLEKDLRKTPFAPLHMPLVTNVDAAVITSGDEAREALVRQVSLPVRWE